MRPAADRGPGEGDHSRADRCLAPLVSRGNVPALAYAVVRDGDAALGGFGGAGPRTSLGVAALANSAGVQPSPLDEAVFEALG